MQYAIVAAALAAVVAADVEGWSAVPSLPTTTPAAVYTTPATTTPVAVYTTPATTTPVAVYTTPATTSKASTWSNWEVASSSTKPVVSVATSSAEWEGVSFPVVVPSTYKPTVATSTWAIWTTGAPAKTTTARPSYTGAANKINMAGAGAVGLAAVAFML